MVDCWNFAHLVGPVLTTLFTSLTLGSVDVALLQATLIWSKCWTRTKTHIVTALVLFLAVFLTGSSPLPFDGIQTAVDTTMHNISNGTTVAMENVTSDNRSIGDTQGTTVNIMLLLGSSSFFIPVAFKLPASGMLNMFLAMVGVHVVVPSAADISNWKGIVVISTFFFLGISGILSGLVFFGFKKFILSKLNPDVLLQSNITVIVIVLVIMNTVTVLLQQFPLLEMIPLWLRIIVPLSAPIIIWRMKRCQQSCDRCCTKNGFENEESQTVLEQAQAERISEQNLAKIASCFRGKWEQFMILLGVPKEDIDEMKFNYPGDFKEQVYRCLRRWQEKNPETATLKSLVEKSSPKYLNMKYFDSILKEMETQGGNAKIDSIIIENEDDSSDDIMEPINISCPLKVQCVCAILIHGSAVMGDILGPATSFWLTPVKCNVNGLRVWKYIVLRLPICIGAFIGVKFFGHRIVDNVGDGGLCKMTPLRCFCIEIGFAFTTLLASIFGLPLSSTIWKIVSVLGVGFVLSEKKPNLKFCLQILMSFLVCGVLALMMTALASIWLLSS